MNPKLVLQKIGTVGIGYTLSFTLNGGFDYAYIPAIGLLGPINGCLLMTFLSIVLNLSLVKLYDTTGKDWLGFESIKEGKESLSTKLPSWLGKVVACGDVLAFIGLSFYDPLWAVIYFRKSDQAFKGLATRDWKIFWFATILANVGWSGIVYGGIQLINIIKVALF